MPKSFQNKKKKDRIPPLELKDLDYKKQVIHWEESKGILKSHFFKIWSGEDNALKLAKQLRKMAIKNDNMIRKEGSTTIIYGEWTEEIGIFVSKDGKIKRPTCRIRIVIFKSGQWHMYPDK